MGEARWQAEKYGIVGASVCHIAVAIVSSANEFYIFERLMRPMFRMFA
jgi:hypothetical protein